MKKSAIKIFIFLTISFISNSLYAQKSFFQYWKGNLELPGMNLPLEFTFYKRNDSLSGIMKSPKQSQNEFPFDYVSIKADSIFGELKMAGVKIRGKLINEDSLSMEFFQGQTFHIGLKKSQITTKTLVRSQAINPPFPYQSIDTVFFGTKTKLNYGSTITLPENTSNKIEKYPTVILITGSGPQDRDETLFNHEPFAVIADALTRAGYLVIRTDDRGVGKTTGSFKNSTSADFANDVESVVDFAKKLPNVDSKKIILLGHSEGGMIAPIVASRRKDIAGLILLAAPAIPIYQLMGQQVEDVVLSTNQNDSAFAKAQRELQIIIGKEFAEKGKKVDQKSLLGKVNQWSKNQPEIILAKSKLLTIEQRNEFVQSTIKEISSDDWLLYFFQFDPSKYLSKIKQPVLALNGDKDIQVKASTNLSAMENIFLRNGNKNFSLKNLGGLNHLFQKCTTCTVAEYGDIEQTIEPEVLYAITDWMTKYFEK